MKKATEFKDEDLYQRKLSTDYGLEWLNIMLLLFNSQSPILNKCPVHLIIRE